MADLRAAGPEGVGLDGLTTWRVARIETFAPPDPVMDTPTRQVLAYAVTVTDGKRRVQKPFVLYAYLDPDGRWRIEQVDVPCRV